MSAGPELAPKWDECGGEKNRMSKPTASSKHYTFMKKNRKNTGLVSANRSNEATQKLTTPSPICESSTRDSSPPSSKIRWEGLPNALLRATAFDFCNMIQGEPKGLPTLLHVGVGEAMVAAFQHGFWLRGVQP